MSRKIIIKTTDENGSVDLWKGARVLTGESHGYALRIYVEYDEGVTEMEARRFMILRRDNEDVPDSAIYITSYRRETPIGSIVCHLYEVKS